MEMGDGFMYKNVNQVIDLAIPLALEQLSFQNMMPTMKFGKLLMNVDWEKKLTPQLAYLYRTARRYYDLPCT